MNLISSIVASKSARDFTAWIEKHIPFVRQWHRFAYEEHFFRIGDFERLFHGVFPNFAAAAAAIPKQFNVGYDNLAAATFLGHGKTALRSSDYPVLFWLSQLFTEHDTLFDFGGYLGITYQTYESLLSYPASLRWIVYDVPAVVARGIELQQTTFRKALSYTTDFQLADQADILLAAGSLQFSERNLSDYLSELMHLPKYVLINKLPLIEGGEFVTLQNMGPAMAPYRIFQKKQFVSSLTNLGYRLLGEWQNEDFACIIPYHLEQSVKAFTGMCLVRD